MNQDKIWTKKEEEKKNNKLCKHVLNDVANGARTGSLHHLYGVVQINPKKKIMKKKNTHTTHTKTVGEDLD